MKNAEDVAKELVERFSGMTFSGGLGTGWLISEIAKALEDYANERILELFEGEDCKVAQIEQDAYRKGAEDMRERAAKTSQESWDRPGDVIYVSEVRHKEPYVTGKEWCDHVAKRIRALSPTEGGAR
mgnify:CR=1 FL=1